MTPASQIAHYRITGKLGEGGMGAVYRATDTKLNREVAIKLLPDSFAADPDRLARFTREAQVLASLNHPNIAAIYGVEDRALVMELVEGRTLAGPISSEEAIPIVEQLIDALEYAHEKGIVHRDLKPDNIRLTPDGRLKVLDFGLAKAMTVEQQPTDATITMRSTVAGMILGTAGYMSPEQARGQEVDKRSDIWSFGVVVHELVTGQKLFDGATISDIIAAVLTRDPDLSALPERFRRLIQRCLTRDPRQRLRDISGARLLLEDAATPTVARRRTVTPWAIAAAVFAIAAGVFAWMWAHVGGAEAPRPFRFTLDVPGFAEHLVSPNGRYIAVALNEIRLRAIDQVSWRTLPGTENAKAIFWAPDSSAIGFFSDGQLRTTTAAGGTVRSLTAAPVPRGGSWRGSATAGQILYAAGDRLHWFDLASNQDRELPVRGQPGTTILKPVFLPESDAFLYTVAEGALRPILYRSTLGSLQPAGERLYETASLVRLIRHPHKGEWLLFYVRPSQSGERSLVSVPIDPRTGAPRGEPSVLFEGIAINANSIAPSFDAAGNGVAVWKLTASALPIWRLRWHDRNGNVIGAVGEPVTMRGLALSPDEKRAAVIAGFPVPRISIYNLQSGRSEPLSAAPAGSHGRPVWSTDGRALYYVVTEGNASRIYRHEVGGIPEALFESQEMRLFLQDITPDGRNLVLIRREQIGGGSVCRLDLDAPAGARKLHVMFQEGTDRVLETSMRITPDGKWLMMMRRPSVYALPYPAGGSPVLAGAFPPGSAPAVGRDGSMFYAHSGGSVFGAQIIAAPGGVPRLGPVSSMFELTTSSGGDANTIAPSRDGNRFLAISTDAADEFKTQVISDWTTLVNRQEK